MNVFLFIRRLISNGFVALEEQDRQCCVLLIDNIHFCEYVWLPRERATNTEVILETLISAFDPSVFGDNAFDEQQKYNEVWTASLEQTVLAVGDHMKSFMFFKRKQIDVNGNNWNQSELVKRFVEDYLETVSLYYVFAVVQTRHRHFFQDVDALTILFMLAPTYVIRAFVNTSVDIITWNRQLACSLMLRIPEMYFWLPPNMKADHVVTRTYLSECYGIGTMVGGNIPDCVIGQWTIGTTLEEFTRKDSILDFLQQAVEWLERNE